MKVHVLVWAVQAAVSVVSLGMGRPWTAILSRRRYPAEYWSTPLFHETNMIITGAWALYFTIATAMTAFGSLWTSVALGVLAGILTPLSFKFGERYSDARLAKLGGQSTV